MAVALVVSLLDIDLCSATQSELRTLADYLRTISFFVNTTEPEFSL